MLSLIILRDALGLPCECSGKWLAFANKILGANKISKQEWVKAVMHSLEHGRKKGTLVCHAGLEGNEGKSFLFGPSPRFFGEDNVFSVSAKTAFPLMGLEKCRLTLLDDWRFNENIIGYSRENPS